MDKLDPDDSRPPYQQVADRLRAAIEDSTHPVGAKLPTHGAVMKEFGVSLGTVKRAFSLLQRERLIVTRQGQGSYVRAQKPEVTTDHAESDGLADVHEKLADLGRRLEAVERQLSRG